MYTVEQEAVLKAAAPVTYADAVVFGVDFGKSTRSVIAKVKQLDLPYVPKPVAAKRPAGKTKAEVIEDILAALPVGTDLGGLEKATGRALANLAKAVVTD